MGWHGMSIKEQDEELAEPKVEIENMDAINELRHGTISELERLRVNGGQSVAIRNLDDQIS